MAESQAAEFCTVCSPKRLSFSKTSDKAVRTMVEIKPRKEESFKLDNGGFLIKKRLYIVLGMRCFKCRSVQPALQVKVKHQA